MLEQRAAELEWMDRPDFGRPEVLGTFCFLEPVNRWFGGVRPLLSFFRRESPAWNRHETVRVLDVGCGAGDVPVALARWSRRRGYHFQIDAIDRHEITVALAQKRCQGYPEISVFYQDVFHLSEREYDYVHASQFLHHFADEEVVPVLNHLLGLSRGKLVINDLVRDPLHYASAWAFTLFASPVFRHDARLSIKRGFVLNELERLLEDGEVGDFRLERHFFYRFLLIVNNHKQ